MKKNSSDLPFLPNEASFILKINDLSKARSLLQNNSLLQQNKNNPLYSFLINLEPLKTINWNINELFICFSPLGKNDFGYTIVFETEKPTPDLDKYYLTDRTYNNFLYKEFRIENQSLFTAQLNEYLIIGSDYLLMENHIKQFENAIEYKYPEAFESLNSNTISLVITNSDIADYSNRLFPNLPKTHLFHKELNGWTAGDFTIDKSILGFNAIYKPQSEKDFSTIFEDVIPQKNRLSEITPEAAKQFTSYSFKNYSTLSKNLFNYNNKVADKPDNKDIFLAETSEIGTIEFSNSLFFACRIPNESIEMPTYFNFEENQTPYRDVSIHKLASAINFSESLKPLVPSYDYQYFINFKEFIIFSKSIDDLKKLISSLKNEKTLYSKDWYSSFANQITDQSNVLTVANVNYTYDTLKESLNDENQGKWSKKSLKKYKIIAFQMVKEEDFSHIHIVTSKSIEKRKDFKVSETENVILSNSIKSTPQFVTNHVTKNKNIIVQNNKNQLIVISNKGEIKWNKNINETILGDIKQMDMYRNGRLQYVFTTPTQLYVLDRNGKEVAPFPLKFEEAITQPVAVFDYDGNRKYRIVITQDSKLKMFDNKGNGVKGFNFKNKGNGSITHVPKHIRVGKKDYIVINESSNGVHFLNRTGNERVKLKKGITESSQEWYWYKNAFSTLNYDNTITQVKTNGEVSYLDSKLVIPNAMSTATSKTWVSFAENTLSIKDKVIQLEFGRYTPPKIFYINNKIYVSITNTDSKKVYLFDSNAKTINGFPVYGTGEASVDNMDKDDNLELIVKGDDNSILFYEFR